LAVGVINDVVKIRQPLLLHELAQDVHVAIGFRVRRKNVMVGNDDDAVLVPDFRRLAELTFENANRSRPANVVRHEHVGFHPNIIAGLRAGLAGGAREEFFSQRHSREKLADARADFNNADAMIASVN
jgi:hypothetical protein